MANIIYAVAGEGFGHSSRSHLIGQHLIDIGHDVIFAGSKKSHKYLSKYFGKRVHKISGLNLAYDDGNVDAFKTIKQNAKKYPASLNRNNHIFKTIFEPFRPDLVITDFEPFTAWWAWLNGIPYISIDHQHILTMAKLEHDMKDAWQRIKTNFVTRSYYAGAKHYIIINFFKAPLTNNKAILTPPVVRKQVLEKQPTDGDHILFYSTDANLKQQITEIAKSFPDRKFIAYGFNIDKQSENCTFKKTSTETFLEDLSSAQGVIATAGFSLISESLHFRKKMLLLPLQGQYEQMLNASYVEKLGLGISAQKLNRESLERFLKIVDAPLSDHPDILWPDNQAFYNRIEQIIDEIATPKLPVN